MVTSLIALGGYHSYHLTTKTKQLCPSWLSPDVWHTNLAAEWMAMLVATTRPGYIIIVWWSNSFILHKDFQWTRLNSCVISNKHGYDSPSEHRLLAVVSTLECTQSVLCHVYFTTIRLAWTPHSKDQCIAMNFHYYIYTYTSIRTSLATTSELMGKSVTGVHKRSFSPNYITVEKYSLLYTRTE